jgi:hypothetical protein
MEDNMENEIKDDIKSAANTIGDVNVDVNADMESKDDPFLDIFVTEAKTFDVKIRYYNKDGVLYVENDGTFDEKEATSPIKELSITFKYPSQGDLLNTGNSISLDLQNISNISALETNRILVLIRKWSSTVKLSNEAILAIDPKFFKAIEAGVKEKIGFAGIL